VREWKGERECEKEEGRSERERGREGEWENGIERLRE